MSNVPKLTRTGADVYTEKQFSNKLLEMRDEAANWMHDLLTARKAKGLGAAGTSLVQVMSMIEKQADIDLKQSGVQADQKITVVFADPPGKGKENEDLDKDTAD